MLTTLALTANMGSCSGRSIRRADQGIDFIMIKEFDCPLNIPFGWYRQYLLTIQHVLWLAHRDNTEERTDACEVSISTPSTIAALRFNIAEEVCYQFDVEIVECEFCRQLAVAMSFMQLRYSLSLLSA